MLALAPPQKNWKVRQIKHEPGAGITQLLKALGYFSKASALPASRRQPLVTASHIARHRIRSPGTRQIPPSFLPGLATALRRIITAARNCLPLHTPTAYIPSRRRMHPGTHPWPRPSSAIFTSAALAIALGTLDCSASPVFEYMDGDLPGRSA